MSFFSFIKTKKTKRQKVSLILWCLGILHSCNVFTWFCHWGGWDQWQWQPAHQVLNFKQLKVKRFPKDSKSERFTVMEGGKKPGHLTHVNISRPHLSSGQVSIFSSKKYSLFAIFWSLQCPICLSSWFLALPGAALLDQPGEKSTVIRCLAVF